MTRPLVKRRSRVVRRSDLDRNEIPLPKPEFDVHEKKRRCGSGESSPLSHCVVEDMLDMMACGRIAALDRNRPPQRAGIRDACMTNSDNLACSLTLVEDDLYGFNNTHPSILPNTKG